MIKSKSYKKSILTSTILNAFAKCIGFLNTLIIAYYFGTNIQTDIYFFILTVALLLTNIINGIDYLVLVPEGMKIREHEGEKSSQIFFTFFIYLYLFIGTILALLILISPSYFYSFFSKFNIQSLKDNSNLLNIGIIIIVFQLLNNLLSAILVSHKYFTATIFSGFINSVFTITFTVIFHNKMGVTGTLLGTAIGYVLNFIFLIYILKRTQHWNFGNVKCMKDKKVWGNIALMQINILPIWIRNAIALYLLSGLGNGIITAVNLGQQISAIPDLLITLQLVSIASIKFNDLYTKKNDAELNEIFIKVCEWGIYITMFISFSSILFSKEITYILFGKSNIGQADLKNSEIVFCYTIACLSVKFIASICTNIITAAQKVRATFFMSVITHSVVTIAIYFLITYYGLIGYLIGINLHFYLFFIFFYVLLKRVMPYINYTKIFSSFLINIVNNIIVFSLVMLIYYYKLKYLQNIYIKLGVGIILYFFLAIIINEFITANRFLKIKNAYNYGIKRFFS